MPEKPSLENEEEEVVIQPLSESADIEHPSFRFIPKGHHEWRQEGPYLVCRSCDLDHGIWVGRKYLLVGIGDDGMPIIKTRKSLGFV